MLHKCGFRIRDCSGFTLAETLLVVLILLLVTVIVVTGIPAAKGAYERVVNSANAEVLLTTTAVRLRDELGMATDVVVSLDGSAVTYTNAAGTPSRIYLDDGAEGIRQQEYVGMSDAAAYDHRLISAAASNKNLYVVYETAIEYSKGVITFKNRAVMNGGNTLAGLETLQIRVLADVAQDP